MRDGFWAVVLTMGCVVGCGGGKAPSEVVPQNGGTLSFSIRDNWQPKSETCFDQKRAPDHDYEYKFDDDHFVMVRIEETPGRLCKTAFIFDRTVASFRSAENLYEENSKLSGSRSKKVCWHAVGRVIQDKKPLSEKIDTFGPKQMQCSFVATPTTVTAQLTGSEVCPGGTWGLVLEKSRL